MLFVIKRQHSVNIWNATFKVTAHRIMIMNRVNNWGIFCFPLSKATAPRRPGLYAQQKQRFSSHPFVQYVCLGCTLIIGNLKRFYFSHRICFTIHVNKNNKFDFLMVLRWAFVSFRNSWDAKQFEKCIFFSRNIKIRRNLEGYAKPNKLNVKM